MDTERKDLDSPSPLLLSVETETIPDSMGIGSERDLAFARAYFTSRNATQAYLSIHPRASVATAQTDGSKNLTKPRVQRELARLGEIAQKTSILTRERLEQEISRLAFSDLGDFEESVDSIDDVRKLPPRLSAAIRKVKKTKRFDKEGEVMSETCEVELHEKGPMVALAANVLGMTKNQESIGVTVVFKDSTDLEAAPVDITPEQ